MRSGTSLAQSGEKLVHPDDLELLIRLDVPGEGIGFCVSAASRLVELSDHRLRAPMGAARRPLSFRGGDSAQAPVI